MTPLLAAAEGTFPVLPWLIAIPAVGALIVALTPSSRTELFRPIALIFSAVAAALGVWMMVEFDHTTGANVAEGFQFVTERSWVDRLGIQWISAIDGISLWLVVMTVLLFPIAIVAVEPGHDDKPYYAWLLLLEAGCLGVFVSLDLFMFFIFFEIVLVPMYFLIAKWGHGNRQYAAMKFFLYTIRLGAHACWHVEPRVPARSGNQRWAHV